MSSKFALELDARRWSLGTRLGLFFGAAIAAIVVGVSTMMYAELVHQLHEKEELEMQDDLQIQLEVFKSLAKRQEPTRWQHEWGEQQEEGERFAWQLTGPDGAVLRTSANAAAFAAGFARRDRPRHDERVEDKAGRKPRFLLVSSLSADRVAGAGTRLRGALDVSQDERVLRRYLRKLALVVAAAVCVAAVLGWLLVRRGLAPLRAISTAIGRINASGLHTRIANEAWPSDLRQLALAFDDMLARLERSFEQLSRFSSDLAHEFRSPINNLVAAASVTLGRARDVGEYQNTLEVMVEEGNRLSRMVSSMLFLARADNAQQTVRHEPLSARAEFDRLVAFFDVMADELGISLRAEGDCRLMADAMLLRRALSNLLSNALRYTPRGGTVTLRAAADGASGVLAVADDGCGIAPEHLPHLFDRFYRADPARSASDSTGLGLAVVRSIAELHGGTVRVKSAPGKGALFELVLPLGREPETGRQAGTPSRQRA
jgi:two-component system heavy metal sensor histidine kinase CusS